MKSMLFHPVIGLRLLMVLGAIGGGAAAQEKRAGPPAVGDEAPDFELATIDEKQVKLSALSERGPVVLVVLRGYPGYQCPICSRQVGQFIGQSKKIEAAGASVVLVYPGPARDLGQHAFEFIQDKPALPDSFRFVMDPNYKFTNAYSLRWDAPRETAYPSTFVIGRDRKVRYAKISKTHGDRASVEEVLKALEAK